jgi:hypothetical protein
MTDIDARRAVELQPEDGRNFRFAREIGAYAPKPGHHLGTAAIVLGDNRMSLLNIIEGAANDAVTVNGIVTDFTATTVLLFHMSGTFTLLDYYPYDPRAYGQVLEFSDGSMSFGKQDVGFAVTRADIVYSRTRSVAGPDPDGGLIRIRQASGTPIFVSFSGFKEGWIPVLVAGVVVAAGYGLYKLADKALDKIGDSLAEAKMKATVTAGPVSGTVEMEFGSGASKK